ncbi:MAG TPA: quinone oxidoreductase [Kineosporiaceae bacterium]|nr:quinone oxidoreductase [Kineosporiaceae bacterium]
MQAIRVSRQGGPGVLEVAEVDEPAAGDGQVVVDVAAAGVNFIDTYQRSGLYQVPLPLVPGLEGAGTVREVGPGVSGLRPGDRVAWCDAPGSYARRAALPAARLVAVPEGLDLRLAAAVMLQGLTAHYLTRDTFPLRAGHRCLVHAGAGGVGLLLIQLAKRAGAEVFTTVGSPQKAELARAAGADHVIAYRDQDFGDAVEAIAGPKPLDVVYDGVGRTTFDRGLELLRTRGMMVTFGNASGPVDPVSPLRLSQLGSLFLTRPTLFHYVADPRELRERAADVLGLVAGGELEVRIGTELPLTEAGQAHHLLESRQTTGKVLLLP